MAAKMAGIFKMVAGQSLIFCPSMQSTDRGASYINRVAAVRVPEALATPIMGRKFREDDRGT